MTKISKLELVIRKYINNPRKLYSLLPYPAAWNKLTSSLDVIGDTELALNAFLDNEWPKDDGGKYLMIYGVLQGLFIQQDATKNLAEALNITYSVDPILKEIREVRHDSIGHPTKREKLSKKIKEELCYNFIARGTMSRQGFMLMKTFPDGKTPQFINVNIPDLIGKQRELLAKLLSNIIEILKKEEEEHRIMYEDQKLINIFPKTLGYYIEKIYESTRGNKPNKFGELHVDLILKCINEFEYALKERGILNNHKYSINEINYPL
ncbi:MAG: hypothetical protein L6277_11200 [Desulfobacterales bacterium]|nr:hypothetical protein [Pseudomonadota bacterium]MBU4353821.1 hypothetical protein [Pseudomonadota bacterium]MCG2772638.1 hypothetical protein [Desulfobacterales bacterium]